MTPKQLLELVIDGQTTLRDVLVAETIEGQILSPNCEDEEYERIAQTIIDAVRN